MYSDDLGLQHMAFVCNCHFWELNSRRWRWVRHHRCMSSVWLLENIYWKWYEAEAAEALYSIQNISSRSVCMLTTSCSGFGCAWSGIMFFKCMLTEPFSEQFCLHKTFYISYCNSSFLVQKFILFIWKYSATLLINQLLYWLWLSCRYIMWSL